MVWVFAVLLMVKGFDLPAIYREFGKTDIDEESDFLFAEFLFKQRHKMETNKREI